MRDDKEQLEYDTMMEMFKKGGGVVQLCHPGQKGEGGLNATVGDIRKGVDGLTKVDRGATMFRKAVGAVMTKGGM